MTSEYSISVDWSESNEDWENEGQRVSREILEDKKHEHHKEHLKYLGYDEEPKHPEDVAYENNEPMMNYAYPLYGTPTDEQIYEVIMKTNCTVMYNTEEDKHYLALTGGGMDLSQSIAFAYILCDERIPEALAFNVCTQYGLNHSGKEWILIMKKLKESLEIARDSYKYRLENFKQELKKGQEEMMKDKAERAKRKKVKA